MDRLLDIIISSKENNAGCQMFRGHLMSHLLAVQSRHVYIQDGYLRFKLADTLNSFRSIRGLSEDSKILLQGKRIHHALPEERMIVCDEQCYLVHPLPFESKTPRFSIAQERPAGNLS